MFNFIFRRRLKNRRHSEAGFSLIELLVVMMVIAIITSIALPNFSSIQTKAKETNLKSLAHSIQLGVESYFVNQGSYPTGTDLGLPALVTKLSEAGAFGATPKNPFTGKAYTEADTSGKITYSFDTTAQTYKILVYGTGNTLVIATLENK